MQATPSVHDATSQAELVRYGDVSRTALVEAAIDAIERLNPMLNAVVSTRFERALEEATTVEPGLPFAGVPYLAKDSGCALAGEPYWVGLAPLRDADHRATVDSYLARRLRDAGFICLGRTNVPQLLLSVTTEPTDFGPTRNPWNLERSPGGSSGGAAAAVAAGLVPVAHANDSGGSIRIPASACGLVGLKPTRGRVSDGPELGSNWGGLNHEFMLTRTVRDAARLLDVLGIREPGDPCAPATSRSPWLSDAHMDVTGVRILVVEALERQSVDQQLREAVRATAATLEDFGHQVVFGRVPELEEEGRFADVMAAGIARDVDRLSTASGVPIGSADLEPLVREMAERGWSMTAPQYLSAVERMHDFARRLEARWRSFDVLLCPTVAAQQATIGELAPTTALDQYRTGLRARTAFTAAFNASGQPALSVPVAESSAGLPIGVQLVGAHGREDILLTLAAQLEAAHPWSSRTPDVYAYPAT